MSDYEELCMAPAAGADPIAGIAMLEPRMHISRPLRLLYMTVADLAGSRASEALGGRILRRLRSPLGLRLVLA